MRIILTMLVVAFCATETFAADAIAKPKEKASPTPEQIAKREEARAKIYKHFGGELMDARNQKGKIVIVNCQKTAKASWLKDEADYLASDVRVSVSVSEGSFDLKDPAVQGEVTIFVADDATMPISLVATESHWAMVNVAKLKTDNEKFFEMRVKKAITRTFALLCGGAGSRFKLSLTENIQKPEDYDKYINEKLAFDVIQRMEPYLAGYGVTPCKRSNYRKACQEGWAPQPTNDVQKAIWTDVHKLPDKPIKIEYKGKKGK